MSGSGVAAAVVAAPDAALGKSQSKPWASRVGKACAQARALRATPALPPPADTPCGTPTHVPQPAKRQPW
jgi:hypothetical protein